MYGNHFIVFTKYPRNSFSAIINNHEIIVYSLRYEGTVCIYMGFRSGARVTDGHFGVN
jgi:hypothetical protein